MIGFFIVMGTINVYTATWNLTDDPLAGIPVATVYFATMMVLYLVVRGGPKSPETITRVQATFPERYR